jgi:nitronate monooxygenase
MFLVSSPEIVLASCRAGIVGTFPALNTRTEDQLDDWLNRITTELHETEHQHSKNPERMRKPAPFGVNLIVHKSNPRIDANLEKVKKYKVPLVITSLGAVPGLIKEVHGYGGVVFHDVTNAVHAKKAASVSWSCLDASFPRYRPCNDL